MKLTRRQPPVTAVSLKKGALYQASRKTGNGGFDLFKTAAYFYVLGLLGCGLISAQHLQIPIIKTRLL